MVGRVIDSLGAPVAMAYVDAREGAGLLGLGLTDGDGSFVLELRSSPIASVSLRVRRIGYLPAAIDLDVASLALPVLVTLAPIPQVLDAIFAAECEWGTDVDEPDAGWASSGRYLEDLVSTLRTTGAFLASYTFTYDYEAVSRWSADGRKWSERPRQSSLGLAHSAWRFDSLLASPQPARVDLAEGVRFFHRLLRGEELMSVRFPDLYCIAPDSAEHGITFRFARKVGARDSAAAIRGRLWLSWESVLDSLEYDILYPPDHARTMNIDRHVVHVAFQSLLIDSAIIRMPFRYRWTVLWTTRPRAS